jgi:leucyl/phenylalanyl-tRNA---protein transferase
MRPPPLDPAQLIGAYASGIFPMGMEDGTISWFSPDPRGLIPLDERFHVPHGLRRTLRRGGYEVRVNAAFPATMRGCAERETTWIDHRIYQAYVQLHYLGYAHSVETWVEGELVGGLYGVALGGVFFGESMFSRRTDASKIALVALVERLRERGFVLLDTQWTTAHLSQFGAYELGRREYLRELRRAIALPVSFVDEEAKAEEK